MLKPYICAACEKVIVDQDGLASLIGLFNKIIFSPPPGEEVPANAVVSKEWTVFSSWDTEPGDERKEYVLCTQMLYPNGSQFADLNKTKINVELNKRSQMKIVWLGFPVGQLGAYTVRTWVEESGTMVVGPIEFELSVERTALEEAAQRVV